MGSYVTIPLFSAVLPCLAPPGLVARFQHHGLPVKAQPLVWGWQRPRGRSLNPICISSDSVVQHLGALNAYESLWDSLAWMQSESRRAEQCSEQLELEITGQVKTESGGVGKTGFMNDVNLEETSSALK